MCTPRTLQELVEYIEKLRAEMVTTGVEKGFADCKTIQLSQELDQLINTYHKLSNKPCSKQYRY